MDCLTDASGLLVWKTELILAQHVLFTMIAVADLPLKILNLYNFFKPWSSISSRGRQKQASPEVFPDKVFLSLLKSRIYKM